jgi:hypothetical protein
MTDTLGRARLAASLSGGVPFWVLTSRRDLEAQMRATYRVLAYALAVEVVVQAMAIAYGLAGLGKWIDDKHVLNKDVWDSSKPHFTGAGGLALHGVNGMLFIPILTLALLVVSFFAKVPGGRKRAAILVGLVVLQVVLGFALHGVPFVATLHVLNAFAILAVAVFAGYTARKVDPLPLAGKAETTVP